MDGWSPWRKTVLGRHHGSRSHAPLQQNVGALTSGKEAATKLAPTQPVEIDGRVTMAFAGSTCAGQPQSVAVPSKCLEACWKKTPMMQLWDRSDGQEREQPGMVDDPSAGLLRVVL